MLEILAGGDCARRLPEDVTDPGNAFDPSRRDRVAPRVPPLLVGQVQVAGGLPAEVIQRVVHQNTDRLRSCYVAGLESTPDLAGKIVIQFVIDGSGAVLDVTSRGSELPDAAVVACVRKAFLGLSFPRPEDGRASVACPIVFGS